MALFMVIETHVTVSMKCGSSTKTGTWNINSET